jgi:hypothetical protein
LAERNYLIEIIDIYERFGYKIRTGLYPWHFNSNRHGELPFTYLTKNGIYLNSGGGISLHEIYFFEQIFKNYTPPNIFIVGNAFGFSTILISLMNPSSNVIAIDAGVEGYDNDEGITLTNKIAEEQNLNCQVVKGFSPQDVKRLVEYKFNGKIDFVFIDGLHTNEQQYVDFEECYRHANQDCIFLLHDVLNYNLKASLEKIIDEKPELSHRILWRTPSGMAIFFPQSVPSELKKVIEIFSERDEFIQHIIKQERITRITRFLPKFLKRIFPQSFIDRVNRFLQSYIFSS